MKTIPLSNLPAAIATGVCVSLATLLATPASATVDSLVHNEQTKTVRAFLERTIQPYPDGGSPWSMQTVSETCARDLVYGSTQQDPESPNVWMTLEAKDFLLRCSIRKGFHLKERPDPEN